MVSSSLVELQSWLQDINNCLNLEIKAKDGRKLSDELAKMHEKDLVRAHKLVSLMLVKLEKQVDNQNDEEFKYLFGEKESAISVLTKLSSMLIKFIPLANDLAEGQSEQLDEDISTQDAEFLEQYVKRCIQAGIDG